MAAVALRLPDPDGTYTAVRLSSDVSGEAFRRDGRRVGARARAAGRAAARVQARGLAPRRRERVDPRPRQPEAHAGRVRGEVGARAAGLRRAGVARGRTACRAASTSSSIRGRGLGALGRRCGCGARPTSSRGRRCGCCWPTTARSTTRSSSLTRFSAAKIADGRAAAAPRRAARARGAQPVVLRLGRVRARAGARHRAGAARRVRDWSARRWRWARASAGWRCCTPSGASRARSAALFLQSGSFFIPRYDSHESGFGRYARIIRFVRETLRDGQYAMPVPTTITVGRAEENAHNNREMARALARSGVRRVPGGGR